MGSNKLLVDLTEKKSFFPEADGNSQTSSAIAGRFALLVSTLNAAKVYLNHVSQLDRQVTSWLPLSEQMFKSQTRF